MRKWAVRISKLHLLRDPQCSPGGHRRPADGTGQIVIADQFHHRTGGQENGKSNEQPHAKEGCPLLGEALERPDDIDVMQNGRGKSFPADG
jgi:hypothetical protein